MVRLTRSAGRCVCGGLLLVALTAAPAALAHEFWLEPSAFRVAPGEELALRLFVGDGFPGEPYGRNPGHLRRFEVIGPQGVWSVEGRPGEDPAGRIRPVVPGLHIVAYQSRHSRIEL